MARVLPVRVDSKIHLPSGLPRKLVNAIKADFKHANPDFHKKRAMGYRTMGTPSVIKTFSEDKTTGAITVPRGGLRRVRDICGDFDFRLRIVDHTTSSPVEFPTFCVDPERPEFDLRPYQRAALAKCLEHGNGIVRAPTGSGKTTIAFAAIHALGERAFVVLRDSQLLKQWKREAERCLGLPSKEIGVVMGGRKYAPGPRLTLALQQSLYRKGNRLDDLLRSEPFGTVVIDEVQGAAARTFLEVIDRIPARHRLGFSADETRKDGKEFLTYDVFGDVIYEVERDTLEAAGHVLPVKIRVIPTEFTAPWYIGSAPGERNWTRLIEEITTDEERNDLVVDAITASIDDGQKPAFVWTGRVEHAQHIADERLFARGYPCGLMLGGMGVAADRFDEARLKLVDGSLDVAIGTYQAIGVGINLPAITTGIVATPIGNNPQYFNQVRGRLVRPLPGKKPILFYMWDRHVFPTQIARLKKWNDDNVEILDDAGRWRPA